MNVNIQDIKNYTKKHLPIIALIVIVLTWTIYIFNKSAPVAEGTYLVYADMILSGKMPYKDFEFMYTPLYTYILTGLVSIFGTKVIVMRTFGAFLYVGIAIGFYLIFREITHKPYAFIAAIVAFFVTMSDCFDLIGDYHSCYVFFALLQILFGLKLLKNICQNDECNKKMIAFSSLSGMFGALCFLTKPQAGLVYFLFTTLSIIICSLLYKKKSNLKILLGSHILSFLTPIIICFGMIAIFSSFNDFIAMVFAGGSKGGILNMLTYHLFNILSAPRSWTIAIATIIIAPILIKIKSNGEKPDVKKCLLFTAIAFAIIEFLIILIYAAPSVANTSIWCSRILTISDIFMITLVLEIIFIVFMVKSYLDKNNDSKIISYVFVLGAFVCIAYTGLFGGAMSYIPAGPLYGFLIVAMFILIDKIKHVNYRKVVKLISLYFPTILTIGCVVTGVLCPYSWWCSGTEPCYNCTYTTDIDYFSGIQMTSSEKTTYENFVELCDIYLTDEDTMYCYSNTVCFYTLAHKLPVTQSVIPWFDICRQDTLYSDLEYLQNNLPKMIVFTDHGQSAIDAHAEQYGPKDGNQAMYDWLCWCVNNTDSPYDVKYTYNLGAPGYVLIRK